MNPLGDYLLVFSATNRKLGGHIDEILEKRRFKKKKERTGIIWVVDKCKKEEDCKKEKKEEDCINEKEEDEEFKTEWPDKLEESENFVKDKDSARPMAAKFKIDIFNPEKLEPLEKLGKKLVSAILFSDSQETDCKLPLLIGQLRQCFSHIRIAAEYTQPENEQCLWEAGVDEVFNRDLLLDHIMALDILNSKSKDKKIKIIGKSTENEAKITDFISRLVHKKDEPILGIRSAYLRSIRLSFKEGKEFSLDKQELQTAADTYNIRLLAVFCKKDKKDKKDEHKSLLKPLQTNRKVTLTNGDCFLLLTHSGGDLDRFEEDIYANKKKFFREM